MTGGNGGAMPSEELAILDSEVHHLRERVAEDREERKEIRTRLESVERELHLVASTIRWGLGVVGGLMVAVLAKLALGH